jgi:flavorubredoxin
MTQASEKCLLTKRVKLLYQVGRYYFCDDTMAKILILYYSHTGNTEKMAKAIAEGARSIQGVEVEIKNYESPQRLVNYDAILVGAPTYHHNMTNNIKKILEEIAFHNITLKNKVGTSFGSYGWSGEAPRLVNEVLENKFEMEVLKPPLLIKYAPDEKGLGKCRDLGVKIAEKIK